MSEIIYKHDFIRSKRTYGLVRKNSSLLLHGYFADSDGNNIEDESLLPKIRFGGISFDDYIGMIKNDSVIVTPPYFDLLFATNVGCLFGGIRHGRGHPDDFYPLGTAKTGMVFVDLRNGSVYQLDGQGLWFLVASVDNSSLDHSLYVTAGDYYLNNISFLRPGESYYNIVVWRNEINSYKITKRNDGSCYITSDIKNLYRSEMSCLMLPGVFPGVTSRVRLPQDRFYVVTEGYREIRPADGIEYIDYGRATRTYSYSYTGEQSNPSYWLMYWSGGGIPFTKTHMRKLINDKTSRQIDIYVSVDVIDFGEGIEIHETESYSGQSVIVTHTDGTTSDWSSRPYTRTNNVYSYTKKANGDASESGVLSVDNRGVFSYERDFEYHDVFRQGSYYGAQVEFSEYGITLGTEDVRRNT